MARIRILLKVLSAAGVSLLCGRAAPLAAPASATQCLREKLTAGDYAQLSANQDAADLALEVRSPAGAMLTRVDGFEYGTERATIVAPADGVYRFCAVPVSSGGTPPPNKLTFSGPRPAQLDDANRIHAEQAATEARTLSNKSDAASLRRSVERDQLALALWEQLGDVEARVATIIQIGDALNALGDYSAAIDRYRAALDLNPPADLRPAAEALANSGVAKMRVGDVEGADAAFTKSLELLAQLKKPFLTAAVENDRASLYRQTGEFQRALSSYFAALPALSKADRSEAVVLGNIGLTYASLGEYGKAASWLERSMPLLAAPKDRVSRGIALMNLGRVRALGGDLAGALAPLRQALVLVGPSANPRSRADALNNLGQVLYKKGDAEAARPLLEEAASLYRTVHDVRGLASAMHYAGLTAARTGQSEEALADLRESLQLRLSARLNDDAVQTLIEIARLERQRSDPAAARQDLERAMTLIEKLRVNVASPDLRATWLATRRAVYEEMLDLLFDLQSGEGAQAQAAAALEVAERARSRSWMDELGGKRYQALRMVSPELAAAERQLTRNLTFLSQKLAQLPSADDAAPRRNTLSAQMDDLELQYASLGASIAREGSVKPEPGPLQAAGIRQLLDDDTVLLEFALGEKNSYIWAVTPRDVKWFRLPGRAVIEKLARPVADLAGARRQRLARPDLQARYRTAAAELSHTLMSPVAGLIEDKELVFSMDGILNYVPVAALPAPGKGELPLGVTNDVSEIPSASMLSALRANPPAPPDGVVTVAVFADPVFAGDPRAGSSGEKDDRPALARLPFSLREAGYIGAAAHGATVLRRIGFDATKKALFDDNIRRATVIHFATHSRIDDAHPELSGIFLSQTDRGGKPRDGLLSILDIYDLRLPTQLAVLSGCATGLGKQVPGDGFVGLTKAFFYAGAARVLVSLWAVDDEGTALFMRAFYTDLFRTGSAGSAAHALRAAREALWKDPRWKDPAYWSGFSLVGEWRPLALRRPAS